MTAGNAGIWIVIPAFNEASTIRDVAARALLAVPRVIVVDDGSTDATGAALEGLALSVLRNERNEGKGAAIMRGLSHAIEQGASDVITLDGDGQHRPEDIPLLIDAVRQAPRRIVIAARLLKSENAPKSRRRANRVADFWIGWAAGHRIRDSQSGFRLYPAELFGANGVRVRTRGFVFESEILIRAAAKGFLTSVVAVPALYPPAARHSHFKPVLDIARITRMVAWQLICKGLNPAGLWRSLAADSAEHPGYRASRIGR